MALARLYAVGMAAVAFAGNSTRDVCSASELCVAGKCCSSAGWCGTTQAYCGHGCQSQCSGGRGDGPRVVGYLRDAVHLDTLDFSAVTHVIAAHLKPDSDGTFPDDQVEKLRKIITKAKSNGVTAFLAIGGGGIYVPYWLELMRPENAQATVSRLVSLAKNLSADGIDVDLENELVLADSYNPFVAALSLAAKAQRLGLSAALAKDTARKGITDETLALYDFVNLMCYDYRGPWNTSPPLQHAPYAAAVDELDYYMKTRGIPGNKIALGVPFYGYDFADVTHVTDFAWSTIVSQYPDRLNDDSADMKYYNGKITIYNKTRLANSAGAGVMIWELGHDVSGAHSLLRQIKNAMAPQNLLV